MSIMTRYYVSDVNDPIRCRMGGTDASIPVIELGHEYGAGDFGISLRMRDPHAQKTWLTNLARQIQLLAASIPVDDEPDAEPDAQVRSILGGAIA